MWTMEMQPIKELIRLLERLAGEEHYLFSLDDVRSALPEASPGAFKVLLSRVEKSGLLRRVCRGIYLYPRVAYPAGMVLFHTAAKLRADGFNYLSLETVLSDTGVISQIPLNWITLMSSGRSHIVKCGDFGHIEYVHTKRRPADVANQLSYDQDCHLWRASVALALRDMKLTRRSMDLIDWEVANDNI
jgi:predicted transcriptional regulator of viral defense system